MKKTLPFLLVAFFFLGQLNAQSTKAVRDLSSLKPVPMPDKSVETLLLNQSTAPAGAADHTPSSAAMRTNVGALGTTIMDVQTYGSTPTRLINYGDGNLSGIWMIGYDAAGGWTDRGTGYNKATGYEWGAAPSDRLEGDVRTGFPSLAGTENNQEAMFTHKTPPPYEHYSYTKSLADTDWTQGAIPSDTPAGMLWPVVAGDAQNGDYLHVIGITTAVAFGGAEYEGMDPHLLYYRSPDSGATWDQIDVIIEGVDSSLYNAINAQGYAIDAKDNYVAIAIFQSWGDLVVYKSDDFGSTWAKHNVLDFPVDKYDADNDSYTFDDLYNSDFSGPDSLAIFTNDESGSVLIDNNGQVHVFFGEMYVTDDPVNGASYYPGWSGLRYWNETYGVDSTMLISDLVDVDGNGTIDVDQNAWGGYSTSLTSHPTAGIDEDNNIYVSYMGLTEEHMNNTQMQHYRHVYLIKTEDGGATWTAPYDMVNDDFYDAAFIPFIEAAFPAMARHVDDNIHFIFQEDLSPGLVAWIDEDPAEISNIVYFSATKDDFSNAIILNNEKVASDLFALSVTPNPAADNFVVSYDLASAGDAQIGLYNSVGQLLKLVELNQQAAGHYKLPMSLAGEATGVYFVQIRSGEDTATVKVVVE